MEIVMGDMGLRSNSFDNIFLDEGCISSGQSSPTIPESPSGVTQEHNINV